jgi:hypothetical protein
MLEERRETIQEESIGIQRVLSAKEVGEMLGISEQEVNQLAEEGRIGYVRLTDTKKAYTMELVAEFIRGETYPRSRRWNEDEIMYEFFE